MVVPGIGFSGFRIDAAKTMVDKALAPLPLPAGTSLATLREEADLKDVPAATLKHFVVPSYFWGAHAYALTPGGAAKLLRRLPVDCPLDVFLAMATHSGDLSTYAAKHKLAKQRTADTSTVTHTGRANSGVVHDPKKLISFDLCPSAADRVC